MCVCYVHGDSEGEHVVVVLPGGVVWNHHAVGDDETRSRGGRREQSRGVARGQDQGLVLLDAGQVLHGQPELEIEKLDSLESAASSASFGNVIEIKKLGRLSATRPKRRRADISQDTDGGQKGGLRIDSGVVNSG